MLRDEQKAVAYGLELGRFILLAVTSRARYPCCATVLNIVQDLRSLTHWRFAVKPVRLFMASTVSSKFNVVY